MADVTVLDILLYGEPIATLARVGDDRTFFAFNRGYIENLQRPTLSLSFKDQLGGLMTDVRPFRMRLMPFLSNLLPEGNMRSYLAQRAGVNEQREFFLLWALGKDLPGAITVRPAEGEPWPPSTDADGTENDAEPGENALRFSLAGVQLKFSAVLERMGGLTIPAKGIGGDWIVKLPSPQFEGVTENEFAMMTLARMMGMNVPEIRLMDTGAITNLPTGIGTLKGQSLAVRRFDRSDDGSAIHIEDFAQIFSIYPDQKYEKGSARNIAQVIGAEGTEADITEFIRRLTFNVLIGNADMHLKNWSMIYPDKRSAALSPAYDFVSTIAFLPDETAALKFSRTKKFREFGFDELSHLAAKAMLPEKLVLDTARETVALFHQHWQAERSNLPLPKEAVVMIDAHVGTIPVCRES